MERVTIVRVGQSIVAYWWIVLLATFCGLAGGAVAIARANPTYQTDLMFYPAVGSTTSGSTTLSTGQVASYAALAGSNLLAAKVAALETTSVGAHRTTADISATVPLNTTLIKVTVKSATPMTSIAIATGVVTQLPVLVADLTAGPARPQVVLKLVSGPDFHAVPVSPRKRDLLGLGGLFGLALGVVGAVGLDRRHRVVEPRAFVVAGSDETLQ